MKFQVVFSVVKVGDSDFGQPHQTILLFFFFCSFRNQLEFDPYTGLAGIPGLSIASNPESPVVFLKLNKSTGSSVSDLRLLQEIADCVSK